VGVEGRWNSERDRGRGKEREKNSEREGEIHTHTQKKSLAISSRFSEIIADIRAFGSQILYYY